MTGTILRGTDEVEVTSTRRPCCDLRELTKYRVKRKCENSADFLPVYKCARHRFCSPFGQNSDPDIIRDCESCGDYKSS